MQLPKLTTWALLLILQFASLSTSGQSWVLLNLLHISLLFTLLYISSTNSYFFLKKQRRPHHLSFLFALDSLPSWTSRELSLEYKTAPHSSLLLYSSGSKIKTKVLWILCCQEHYGLPSVWPCSCDVHPHLLKLPPPSLSFSVDQQRAHGEHTF